MLDNILAMIIGATIGFACFYLFQKYCIWSKWELVEENKKVNVVTTNPIMGKISEGNMTVNVYKKVHKRTGLEKFKSVPTI